MTFKVLSIATAGICLALVVVWLFAPGTLLELWGMSSSGNPLAGLLGRRTAALFAGLGLMFYLARNAGPSASRAALARGLAFACLALALLGLYELSVGHAGIGILSAAIVETALAFGLLTVRA